LICRLRHARELLPAAGRGNDERVEVFGSKGMVESQRQRFRGVSRYLGDKVIEDGLYPGWFEQIEQSYYEALGTFVGAITQGTPPNPSLEDGLKAQLLGTKPRSRLRT
jgi:myo-inositol 2-dehydrogenase/D-chiro-inositol 1-dehydrogenase